MDELDKKWEELGYFIFKEELPMLACQLIISFLSTRYERVMQPAQYNIFTDYLADHNIDVVNVLNLSNDNAAGFRRHRTLLLKERENIV